MTLLVPPNDLQVICLDLDGVLVQYQTTHVLAGVSDALFSLRACSYKMAVVTNQAGPLWRYFTDQEKYPDAESVARRLYEVSVLLTLWDVPWFVAISDEERLTAMIDKQVALASASAELNQRPELAHPGEKTYRQKVQEESKRLANVLQARLHHYAPTWKVFVSSSAFWRKPNSGMIVAASAWHNAPTTRCALVDDQESNAPAATSVGARFFSSLDALIAELRVHKS